MPKRFCLILSDIGTPIYKIAKFFVPLPAPLTSNEYTLKDSFSLSEKRLTFDSNLAMVSFGIESLFTNTPFKKILTFTVEVTISKVHTGKFELL